MNSFDLIRKFHSALPIVRKWIDDLLIGHRDHATPIINLGFPRLQQVFPSNLLEKAKAVVVKGKIPYPPLSKMGLSELSQMESRPMVGITYIDTVFINQDYQTESLYFHELIHVVQWDLLGVENFLLAYGVGLVQKGYENSPLERMAYSLQKDFDRGILYSGIVDLIEKKTDETWKGVLPLLARA